MKSLPDEGGLLPERVRVELQAHVEAEYPDEACGILFGEIKPCESTGLGVPAIKEYVRIRNECQRGSKTRHYRLDPMTIYRYEQEYSKKRLEIAGFVHSHPDKPAVMSAEDEKYMMPELLYVIAEVTSGKCRDIRIWRKMS